MNNFDLDNFTSADYSKNNRNEDVPTNKKKPSRAKNVKIKKPTAPKKKKIYKGKFPKKLAIALISLGVTANLLLNNPDVQKTIDNYLDRYNRIEETMVLNPNAELDKAALEVAKNVIREHNLEQHINLENTYITSNKEYSLDNYFLYQMITEPSSKHDEYAELAFALPILNDKKADRNSEIYKKAQELLIKNADTLMQKGENIAKDKLVYALSTVNPKSLPEDKRESFMELQFAAESGDVIVERSVHADPDLKTLEDIMYYKKEADDGYNTIPVFISVAGRGSGKTFLDPENLRRQIDGHNSISDAAKLRGDVLLAKQIYNSNISYANKILEQVLNDPDISKEDKQKERDKFNAYVEKEEETYSNILLKVSNLMPVVDNTEIKELDYERGKVIEDIPDKDKEIKNFKNFVKQPHQKTYAIEKMNQFKEQSDTLEDYGNISLEEIEEDNLDIISAEEKEQEKDDFDRDY